MAYFPESLLPSNIKQTSSDVGGNQFIVSASDYNRHDEEIRAIEKFIGTQDSANGCSLIESLKSAAQRLQDLRDGIILTTSGVVSVKDASVGGTDGIVPFPTSWTTTLSSGISASTTLPVMQLASVSGLPTSGYVSIINDVSLMPIAIGRLDVSKKNNYLFGQVNAAVYTSLVSTDAPIYNIQLQNSAITQDALALGSNVEIFYYNGIDVPNKKLLNVTRSQLNSTATRHGTGDVVFKGILSVQVSPFMFRANYATPLGQVSCLLRSNGRVDMSTQQINFGPVGFSGFVDKQLVNNNSYPLPSGLAGFSGFSGNGFMNMSGATTTDNTDRAYATYQATLIQGVDPIPSPTFGTKGCL